MITSWNITNFKSIRNRTELSLAPLTVFSGANSSGKSTFIQSILLIAQTLASKVSSRSVVLNGALTSLGQFDDLRSNESESDQIRIRWTCSPAHNSATTLPTSRLSSSISRSIRVDRTFLLFTRFRVKLLSMPIPLILAAMYTKFSPGCAKVLWPVHMSMRRMTNTLRVCP